MKKQYVLAFLFLFAMTGWLAMPQSGFSQEYDVLVTPDEIELEPGESHQLDTNAFSMSGNSAAPAAIDSVMWEMTPDSMGTITDDGFFVAGQRHGIVEIKATFFIGDRIIVKIIIFRIGKLPQPLYTIKVIPERVVVPIGHEQQFEVVFTSIVNVVKPDHHVRWQVVPETLGAIDDSGLFTAGDDVGRGKVIAYVETSVGTIRGAADVTVGPLPSSAIDGNIVDDNDASPLAGAVVKAFRLGHVHWVKYAETDDNGDYQIDDLIPGNYILHASARGYIGEYYDNARNYLEAFILSVGENETLSDKDFSLSPGAKIKGQVIADADDIPLEGAHVVARLKLNPRFARHILTDEEGNYSIGSLPTGSYVVQANKIGYTGEYFKDKATFHTADLVNVSEPDSVEDIDFDLATHSAISGMVVNAVDSSAIEDATIRVFRALNITLAASLHHRPPFRETKTDEKGKFIIQVPPGHYFVLANAAGFNPEFFDDARRFVDATIVPVAADSHSANIDFDLVAKSSISGKVADENSGDPIAGAVVEAFYEQELLDVNSAVDGFRAVTNESGEYEIGNLPSGKYLVRAVARTYLPEYYDNAASKADADIVDVADSTDVIDIDFSLEKGGAIAGLVASEVDSLPIPNAIVKVFESNTGRHLVAYTDRDGIYRVTGVPTGEYYVRVIAENFIPEFYDNARHRGDATLVTVLAPDETGEIDVYLQPFQSKRGSIAGRVMSDVNDTPLMGAVVVAMSAKTRHPYFAFTGPRGFYHLTDLPAGRYYVFAWSHGFIGEFWDDVRRFKNATAVVVVDNQISAGIDFGLKPKTRRGHYTVRGRIQVRGGMSAHGVLVQARIGDDVEVNAITDVNGYFVIEDLPAGEYKIEATAPGYRDVHYGGSSEETATPVTLGGGADLFDVNMTMDIDDITDVESETVGTVPQVFDLAQNYPNPFNPETTIKYQIAQLSDVTLKIYNLMGQEVRTLVQTSQQPGTYSALWNGKDNAGRSVATGIYIFQLTAGENFRMSKRMILLK